MDFESTKTVKIPTFYANSLLCLSSLQQLVFVDFEFASERSLRIRILVHATAAICELQAKIGGRITVASVYV